MMKTRDLFLPLLLALLVGPAAVAQNQPPAPSPAEQSANALWQEQKWEGAAKAYEALTRSEPNNGRAWYRLGSSLMSLQNYAAAVAPLAKASDLLRGPQAHYALGAAYAMTGD